MVRAAELNTFFSGNKNEKVITEYSRSIVSYGRKYHEQCNGRYIIFTFKDDRRTETYGIYDEFTIVDRQEKIERILNKTK